MPSEILINPALLDLKEVTNYVRQHTHALVELREDACYQQRVMEDAMTAQFGGGWRNTCGFAQDGLVPYAFGALLGYLHETQKHGIDRIKSVQNYADAQYMRLSPVTRANLELTETMRGREKRGTLLWVLDKTETSMGKRQLRAWIRAAAGGQQCHKPASGCCGSTVQCQRDPCRLKRSTLPCL